MNLENPLRHLSEFLEVKSIEVKSLEVKSFEIASKKGSLKFKEGFLAIVTLTDEQGQEFFKKKFHNEAKFQGFIEHNIVSLPKYSLLKASFFPVQIENCDDFTKYVLFPTLINHALKVDGCVKTALCSLIGLSWDILTLVPRILTTPFRLFCCDKTEKVVHPLIEILGKDPTALAALTTNRITAHLCTRKIHITQNSEIEPEPAQAKRLDVMEFSASVINKEVIRAITTNRHGLPPLFENNTTTLISMECEGSKTHNSEIANITYFKNKTPPKKNELIVNVCSIL